MYVLVPELDAANLVLVVPPSVSVIPLSSSKVRESKTVVRLSPS